jgi:GntR family colanic acid and biofilm gene transcriptional regulator
MPRLTRSAFAELVAIRAELEPLALRVAVSYLTGQTLDALDIQLDQHIQARGRSDPEAVLRTDCQFLFIACQASGSPMRLQFI